MDVLLVISHKLTKEEYRRVSNMYSHMTILSDTYFPNVVRSLKEKRYKLVVFLSFNDSLPPAWKVNELHLSSPIMILLKVNKLDLLIFYSFLDAVGLLSGTEAGSSSGAEVPQLLYKSIEYIEENLCENDLCLENVASSIYVSRCHYSRMFKEHIGIGFKEYIMSKRIQKAKVLLQEGMQVTDVCYAVGYGDLTHFGRVFKKMVGINPSEYKRTKGRIQPCG